MKYSFGTDEYIEFVINHYSAQLMKLAFTYVKSLADAEDIVQDVFVNLIQRNEDFQSEEHERAWLIRVTINKCKNHLNSSWIKRNIQLDEEIPGITAEETEVLKEILELPKKYRIVIHLFYYEQYSIQEIATILKKNPATIGTHLARGRKLLKSLLLGGQINE